MKCCSRCKIEQSTSEFYKTDHNTDGFHSWCKSCFSEDGKRKNATPERKRYLRNYHLTYRFKMTAEEYNSKVESQGGVCACCGAPEIAKRNGAVVRLAIDHDHRCCPDRRSCGLCVRDIICHMCNTHMAVVDNRERLEMLIAYRDRWDVTIAERFSRLVSEPLIPTEERNG